MKQFSIEKYSLGRHETFAIRYGWLTKGFQAWTINKNIFNSDEATVKLGVGRNMVNSIRYWLTATSLLESDSGGQESTPIAEILLSGNGDLYMEDEATIWLIHWLLASNPQDATVFFWFFNRFHKSSFTTKEVFENYFSFVSENYLSSPSEKTLKNDISVLLRSYYRSNSEKSSSIEDSLDSPLAELNLIHEVRSGHFNAGPKTGRTLPKIVLEFAIVSIMQDKGMNSIPISELMHSDGYIAAPGSVFRLTEEWLVGMIEGLTKEPNRLLELRDTAGVRQVYYVGEKEKNPLSILKSYYKSAMRS